MFISERICYVYILLSVIAQLFSFDVAKYNNARRCVIIIIIIIITPAHYKLLMNHYSNL